jgi:hypothetical protein
MINNIIADIIMFLCSILYKKHTEPILYMRGTGDKYPRYLLYTEDENIYKRMDKF